MDTASPKRWIQPSTAGGYQVPYKMDTSTPLYTVEYEAFIKCGYQFHYLIETIVNIWSIPGLILDGYQLKYLVDTSSYDR